MREGSVGGIGGKDEGIREDFAHFCDGRRRENSNYLNSAQTTSIQLKVLEITSKSSMVGSWQWGKHLFYLCIFLSILSILCFFEFYFVFCLLFSFFAFLFSFFFVYSVFDLVSISLFISNIDVVLIVCFYTCFLNVYCSYLFVFFDYYLCVFIFSFFVVFFHCLFCLFISNF